MLTGNLVRVKSYRGRVVPLYLKRDEPYWLEVAESLLLIFREGKNSTRGALADEILAMLGEGVQTLAHRGLAKVLEDRAEFEVVSDIPPETLREAVFLAAAQHRQTLRETPAEQGHRRHFQHEAVLSTVSGELGIPPDRILAGLFADLKDENRMTDFADISAQRLVDRYNLALAQAVLLRATRASVEIRNEAPARYRQIFRWLKFHRLLYQVEGSMAEGYVFHIDGPLSLFSATNRYGLQMALFLPAILPCRDFRLDAELRWGPRREPRHFLLTGADGLVSHLSDPASFHPPELAAFVERFAQVAPAWQLSEATDLIELGREGLWIPDYRAVHRQTGLDVYIEILGFWKRASLDRLLGLLPRHGPPRYLLALSDRLKVDEDALADLPSPVLRFREIPNAPELAERLEQFLPPEQRRSRPRNRAASDPQSLF